MRTLILTVSVLALAGSAFAGQWSHNYRSAKRSNKGGGGAKAAPGKASGKAAPNKAESGFSRDFKQALWAGESQPAVGRAPVKQVRGLDDETPAPGYLKAGALIRTEGLGYKTSEAAPSGLHQVEGGTAIGIEDSKAVALNGPHKGVIVAPKDKVPPPNPGTGATGANAITAGTPTEP